MPAKSSAQLLLEKADKKAMSSTGWFASSSTKFEEAGDLYQQAAAAFKIEKSFLEAGEAYAREAECRQECKETNEAANAWWNASKAFKQQSPNRAIEALSFTIQYLTQGNRFRQAADRKKDMGQIYLQQGDLQKACECLERAGDWYAQEEATAAATTCYKEAADLHAELEDYSKAIQYYEQTATNYLKSSLTKYSAKDCWLRSGICALALGDIVTARRNMERYKTQDPAFSSSMDAKFLNFLVNAVDAGDLEAFVAALAEFDQIVQLDNWKTMILLRIRKSMEEEGGLT